MKKIALFVILVAGVSCSSPSNPPVSTKVTGEVSDIRITLSVKSAGKNNSGDSAVGALVGGLAAGGMGAVAGAIVGSSNQASTRIIQDASACGFTFKDGENQVVFRTTYEENVQFCSLLREGDRISIEKVTYPDRINYSWRPDRSSIAFEYGELIK